jgi:hypothetical protein
MVGSIMKYIKCFLVKSIWSHLGLEECMHITPNPWA